MQTKIYEHKSGAFTFMRGWATLHTRRVAWTLLWSIIGRGRGVVLIAGEVVEGKTVENMGLLRVLAFEGIIFNRLYILYKITTRWCLSRGGGTAEFVFFLYQKRKSLNRGNSCILFPFSHIPL